MTDLGTDLTDGQTDRQTDIESKLRIVRGVLFVVVK